MHVHMMDRQHMPLLIGIVSLLMAVAFTLIGETLTRYHGIVSRAEDPKRFWWNVVGFFLVGLFFIGAYLYEH